MIELEQVAQMIVTDSGGVRKEAFFFAKPSVTLRDGTEWDELVDAGWNRLASPSSAAASSAALGSSGTPVRPYGDAARRFAHVLLVGAT